MVKASLTRLSLERCRSLHAILHGLLPESLATSGGHTLGFKWCLGKIVKWIYFTGEWQTRLDGISVVVIQPQLQTEELVSRLREAVRFLDSVDAYRSRIVRRYLQQIVIWHGDYTAADRFGGVHMDRELVAAAPIPFIASALVHEAIHQRIARRGIAYSPNARPRIEALCVREQASFLRQSADTRDVAELVEQGMDEPWWNESDRLARIQRNITAHDLPAWASRLVRCCNR